DDVQLYTKPLTAEEAVFLHTNPGDILPGEDGPPPVGGALPPIALVARSADGVSLTLPPGETLTVEYSVDLRTWETIATEVSGVFEDSDDARTNNPNGFYRARRP
ncbi:MAG: hypothetical protein AAF514_16305, partial [Verrucomicrobiota bacterium]